MLKYDYNFTYRFNPRKKMIECLSSNNSNLRFLLLYVGQRAKALYFYIFILQAYLIP